VQAREPILIAMPAGGPSDHTAFLADAEAALAAWREPRLRGPGPKPETLRRAYLDLLKLALCDLVGPSTTSVGAMPDGTVLSRELQGEARKMRTAGLDWPLHGLTMVGLERLDDLQRCVESVVADGIEGDLIEAGSWRGGASILMRATLDTLGEGRTVVVADSFAGFPVDSALEEYDFLAAPLGEVQASFERLGVAGGVRFVPGFFEATLPPLAGGSWAIVRLDADTYEPTRVALRSLYPGLAPGGYLVLDDYGSFPECRRAVDEFRETHGITEPIERIDPTGVRWRRESETPIEIEVEAATPPRAITRERSTHVPTEREVELARELADAEAAIGLRPWLRRKLAR
jgi:O-methyltransferase